MAKGRGGADSARHIEAAWTLVAETLKSGTMTLANGEVRDIETAQLVNLVKWLASLNAVPKKHTVPVPESFRKIVG